MLAIYTKRNVSNWDEKFQREEITVFKKIKKIEYEDNKKIEYEEEKPVNLTRKINETAKVLKQQTAREKLELIAKAING